MSSSFLLNLKLNQIQAELDALVLSGPVQNPMVVELDANNKSITNVSTLTGASAIITNATITNELQAKTVLSDNLTASDTVTCKTLVYETLSPPVSSLAWVATNMTVNTASSLTITTNDWSANAYTTAQQPSMNGYTLYTSMDNLNTNQANAGFGITSQPGVPYAGWDQSGLKFASFNYVDLGFLIDGQLGGGTSGQVSLFTIVDGVTTNLGMVVTVTPNAPIEATIYYNDTTMELYINNALAYTYTYTSGTLQSMASAYAMVVGGFNGTLTDLSFFPSASILNNPSNEDLDMNNHRINNITDVNLTGQITINKTGSAIVTMTPVATQSGMKLELTNYAGSGYVYDTFFNPPPGPGSTSTLTEVLTAGSDGGGLSITNIADLTCTNAIRIYQGGALDAQLEPIATQAGMKLQIANSSGSGYIYDSFFNPPPEGSDQNLTQVLTVGNDAGGLTITNVSDISSGIFECKSDQNQTWLMVPNGFQKNKGQLTITRDQLVNAGSIYDSYYNPVNETIPFASTSLTMPAGGTKIITLVNQSQALTTQVIFNCPFTQTGIGYTLLELNLEAFTSKSYYTGSNLSTATPNPAYIWITADQNETFDITKKNYNYFLFSPPNNNPPIPTSTTPMFLFYTPPATFTTPINTLYVKLSYVFSSMGGQGQNISYNFDSITLTGEASASSALIGSSSSIVVPPNP